MSSRSAAAPALAAAAIGLGIGVLTSLMQAVLDFPWLALVNAVSPWLTTAFVAGALQRRLSTAVWIGMAATLLEVVGYYVTAELRGFAGNPQLVAMWTVCAIVGGPVFGAAGHAWRRGRPRGVGAAALVAVWACEAALTYQVVLGYTSTAALFGVIALVLAVGLGWHRAQHKSLAVWLAPALVLGVAGNAVLRLVVG